MAYTPDSIWRNRDQFLQGRDEIKEFLSKKWANEDGYRLRKELFAFTDNKVCDIAISAEDRLVPITSTISIPSIRIYINSSVQIAVQFWYEWHDTTGQWWRTYGLEDWTFADNGLMRKRQMSGNDVKITNEERWFTDGVDVNTVDISEKHW